jgi:hypothetical protein
MHRARASTRRVISRWATLAFLMYGVPAAGQSRSAGGASSSAGAAFLSRPYTLRDRAIDEMSREAKEWAGLAHRKENYSDDLAAPTYGIIASGGAGPIDTSSRIFVTISFGVRRIVGDRRSVCEQHLRRFADTFHGRGRDAYGEDLMTKNMRWRLGPAGMRDDPAVKEAALELIRRTVLRLSIVEMDDNASTECRLDASNVVSFADVSGN